MDYKLIIKRNPDKRFGKPCVRETRITVFDVLGCLAYAADREHKFQYA
jgi:uncharacterized protein (DUF433 family)